MTRTFALVLLIAAARSTAAQHQDTNAPRARVTELQRQTPPSLNGNEVVMLSVEYPPGAVSPRHSHPGPTFVYIVEGTICSEVKGQPAKLYSAGDSFFEPDGGWHAARNTSGKPVKLIATIIAPKGATLAAAADGATMQHSLAPTCTP